MGKSVANTGDMSAPIPLRAAPCVDRPVDSAPPPRARNLKFPAAAPPTVSKRAEPVLRPPDCGGGPRGWFRETPAFLISLVVHLLAVLALALLTAHALAPGRSGLALVSQLDDLESFDDLVVVTEAKRRRELTESESLAETTVVVPEVSLTWDSAAPAESAPSPFGAVPVERGVLAQPIERVVGGGLEGRTPGPRRDELAASRGASGESLLAVQRGLHWLKAHQLDDGGWHFDHTRGICNGLCANPGEETSRTAATAIALLAFLGDGHTHREGEHQEVVRKGLYFLSTQAIVRPEGADLQDGTMYGQGMATMAFCEAYAMTGDPALKDLAQRSVRFIVAAQDTKGGGWRYVPREPGDTTVTGWQLMALKSAQLARLDVPTPSVMLVNHFLDGVQSEEGARYGYLTPEPRRSTTAIGLLCRMYLGWPRNHAALRRGLEYLGNEGHSEQDIYYNYYAAQALCHDDGPLWKAWNPPMRDYLIAAQAQNSHESGSWFFPKDYGAIKGGRLYCTAMAVMTLEVYYRFLPLYGDRAAAGGF
ncbi:MAG: hypothetical protein ACOY3P_07760 [Planctomycetota bacterium]